jgi:predicted enzyme related to lactoylglutathione lyase
MGPESGGYGMFRKDGHLIAGIGPASDADRGTSWAVYFATDDVDATVGRVSDAGGTVVAQMDVFEEGRMAVLQDPSGAFFSVWQAGKHRGMETTDGVGTLTWAELYTEDIESVKPFYHEVLGVGVRDVMGGEYTLLEADGKSTAGMMAGPTGPSRWTPYFEVADVDVTADRAVSLGATEVTREDSPAGRYAVLIDPQGGTFNVMTPDPDFTMD